MAHEFPIRVYYEDTDLAGIVFYANYLKFIERGRSELIRALGIDQAALKADQGLVFAVRRVEADYLRSAKYDDELIVTTEITAETGARIMMDQTVERDGEVLFAAHVVIVCMNEAGAPQRLPADIRRKLSPKLH
ncbi:tol-pal system-associated acyl-CoA thioesterase [Thioclava pacifica]|uniref:Thioesterase domain-containing protein n=1 Tax=Thioclava pacifica DSM 10166 TaxID=1353537 RepID=A0A074JER8_9RHOB|nr:tol-pal system-associated acyl-CoA thioesterase [Thioclava pacifica]KEO54063.1 hypothetical protein TP2_03870 [Thioclava pacifica DSM 10166]